MDENDIIEKGLKGRKVHLVAALGKEVSSHLFIRVILLAANIMAKIDSTLELSQFLCIIVQGVGYNHGNFSFFEKIFELPSYASLDYLSDLEIDKIVIMILGETLSIGQ